MFIKYVHSTEYKTVFISVVIANDDVVIEYTHLEHSVVCTDAQIRDRHNTQELNDHTCTHMTTITSGKLISSDSDEHHAMLFAFVVFSQL